MDTLAEELIDQLNPKVCFEIPIFGGIPVSQSVVATWGIMFILTLASIILVRNLKVVPGRKQLALEIAVSGVLRMFDNILGKDGRPYVMYLSTVLIYIGIANITGVVGVAPPTKDLNVTAALAVMSILLIEYAGIRKKGVGGWIRSFAQPIAVIAPFNILDVFTRPISLCMRLFGNVLGAFVIMQLIDIVAPVIVPVPLSLYFDFFDGFIQAYVFVFLTSLFLREALDD